MTHQDTIRNIATTNNNYMLSNKETLNHILRYVNEIRRKDPNKALEEAEKGLELAQNSEEFLAECKLHHLIGGMNLQKGNLAVAKRHLFSALNIYQNYLEEDVELLASILLAIGSYFFDCSDFERSLSYFLQILQYDLKKLKPALYNNIASVYLRLEKYNQAFEYLFDGLRICLELDDKDRRIFFLYNIGMAYHFQHQYQQAIDYFTQTIEAIEVIEGYQYMKCLCIARIGTANFDLKRYDDAINYYNNGLAIAREHELYREEVRIMIRIGETKLTLNIDDEFLNSHRKSLELANHYNLNEEKLDILRNLKSYYQKHKDFEKAFSYAEEVIELQNQIFSKERGNKIKRLVEEKKYEIALLEKKNKQIAEQNLKLGQSNKMLEQFAYVVAHDLREPLRSIISFTNLLERRYSSTFDEQGHEFMNFIINGAKHMNTLLSDLLSYTTIKNTDIPETPVDLNEVVHEILQILHASIENSGAKINSVQLPEIVAHRTHLIQVFQQLIHNAIKFRDKERPCEINITCQDNNTHYLFTVQDNSIGFDPKFADKIFKLFHRLDKRNYEGTGIGLAICSKIIQLYGGEIWVESELNVGTTFFFTLSKT